MFGWAMVCYNHSDRYFLYTAAKDPSTLHQHPLYEGLYTPILKD